MRNDYALINHSSMKERQMNVSNEALYGQGTASLTPAVKLPLVEEFKAAAQEFVDAADAGADLEKYVEWFKALLR
ncbi:hypothetical protein GFL93_12760 [Rhizobium leguminosarum bv. viciae]|uniref:hypothetical protein n=1 Tax=Rhizobium TaxID=379 RepID=UPI0014426000|nr:hypothetical protein [Rhizobium leguminosarum]NKK06732.1 hypothetical protein [Rhizobium leguminosarum bv. viciae]